jgi:hypothetical protein
MIFFKNALRKLNYEKSCQMVIKPANLSKSGICVVSKSYIVVLIIGKD